MKRSQVILLLISRFLRSLKLLGENILCLLDEEKPGYIPCQTDTGEKNLGTKYSKIWF